MATTDNEARREELQALLTPDNQVEFLRTLRELAMEARSSTDREMRSALRQSMRRSREERVFGDLEYEVRDAGNGGDVTFDGFACITGEDATYAMSDWLGDWDESVSRGAFGKTLSELTAQRAAYDVIFVENHGGRPLARLADGRLSLDERQGGVPTGLHVNARMNSERHDVHDAMAAVRDGTYNQMSFAFRVVRQEWNEDYSRRWIREVDMRGGDVALVSFGANDRTLDTTSMRSAADPIRLRSADQIQVQPVHLLLAHSEFANWVHGNEWRSGKVLSTATMDTLRQVLALAADEDADVREVVTPEPEPVADDEPTTTVDQEALARAMVLLARNRERETKRRRRD